jgi:hypothetical protein
MVIVQFIHKDRVVKTHPVDVEHNKKNWENIEADIKRGIIPKPKVYDRFELYETK